ncbi:MAG: triose-phosphate isomerase [Opitutales bacterium]|nr:triose-phosphate isomerase [Opitutales bacterium]
MSNKSRRFLIAGNWKMNKTTAEAKELATEVVSSVGQQTAVGIVVCPPYTSLESVGSIVSDSTVNLGAQNMHHEAAGAYTGEVSAEMLRDLFASSVILGHSERREYFAESDELINQKVLAALQNNLRPILCVGETLEDREAGDTLKVVETQLRGGLVDVTESKADQVVIAYEPVWAIGTGKTATPEMAQEVHAAIRALLIELFGETGDKIRILYGGSMKPGNAEELLKQPDIDGGLIGGAALKAKDFCAIVETAVSLSE